MFLKMKLNRRSSSTMDSKGAGRVVERLKRTKLFYVTSIQLLIFSLSIIMLNQVPFSRQLQAGSKDLQPIFTKNMDTLTIKENTPVGDIIYTLEAHVDRFPQAKVLYSIEGTQLFAVDKQTGQVRVAQTIDREMTGDSVTFRVSAAIRPSGSQINPITQLTVTVLILDENDNPPKIERVRAGPLDLDSAQLSSRSPFGGFFSNKIQTPVVKLTVNESLPVGSTLVDLIEAIDVDKASSNPLSSTCLDCSSEFELRTTTDSLLNDRLNLSIALINPLQHVPRNNIRQLHIVVSDGKFNASLTFEITIEDIQNKPPQFIGSTTCVIEENLPIDKIIMQIQAIDGDAIGLDDAAASIMGKLATNSDGVSQIGRQILYDLLPGVESSRAMDYVKDFKLHPLTGQLQVANRIDREAYLSLNGILTLRVRARELIMPADTILSKDDQLYDAITEKLSGLVDSSPEASSESDITVILVDVNDHEPHWLNGSEILALNSNQSPFWFNSLPVNDRDPGRVYSLQIKENSLPGTPVTTKNELFVYDLDNGSNSVFNITLIDPFNLFEVEPKQVTGFALVTLKLINRSNRNNRLLDYENMNERNLIVQLIATENNTRERFSSKAQIQIGVLDVNDNAPEFKEANYHANIREDAQAGRSVLMVHATDKDEVSKQLAYTLHGKSAYLFDINKFTGLITVAKCEQFHGSKAIKRHCIDYEQQKSHHLMVEVSDGELSSKVPLTIFIDDAPDNPPVFSLPVVDVVIEEGSDRLDPPIKIEAQDVDQSSILSYSIVEGNFEGLFSINNVTGELQLTRPIRIQHENLMNANNGDYRQHQLNKMTLTIQATDGVFAANGTIRIDVLDANDNAPEFSKSQYEAEIDESVSPGHRVTQVTAFDLDRGNNAQVSYSLLRGSYGQFEVDPSNGEIRVAKQATNFDSSKRENYTLEVIAYDHGMISKSSSVLVLIRVINTNKRAPVFDPQIQKAFVHETTLNNTIVHRMNIKQASNNDDDLMNAMLMFEPGPIEAMDKNNLPIASSERLESMFSVSTNTGDIMVNSDLDHDYAANINLTIFVSYRPFSNQSALDQVEEFRPRSVGYIIITIVDDNGNAPMFAPPWTQQEPELNFQMLEELPVGSQLTQLNAYDTDNSKISHFKIDPPNEYFELTSPTSGVIVIKRSIDYDALMRQTFVTPGSVHYKSANLTQLTSGNNVIQFNVYVYDSGVPQLSAKATVSVEILPINDWNCIFEQSVYEVRLRENALADTFVLQVRANDLDYGEEHNSLRYQLVGEQADYFNVDSKTGLITVSGRGSSGLDRERLQQSTITLVVVGRDEQVTLQHHQSQQPPNLFKWKQSSSANQQQLFTNNSRSCSATVKIHIDDINDNPPLFSQKVYEVSAYDTDIVDVPLIKLMVRDEDSSTASASALKPSSQNLFKILSGNANDIFNITKDGILYATKPLVANNQSSEHQQSIQLRVQVKQQSTSASSLVASFSDECLVNVNLVKVNRYGPEWRFDSSKQISVLENTKPATLVTQLRCIDRDYESTLVYNDIDKLSLQVKSPIRYHIKSNGQSVSETHEFKLDPVSGNLITRLELDRENREYYQLIVSCEDNGRPQSLESLTSIYILVRDVDDNRPEFLISRAQDLSNNFHLKQHKDKQQKVLTKPMINFSIEEHQSKGLPVGELKAIDRDLEGQFPINYCLIEGNEFEEFSLDRVTGILYTNQTLDREKQSTYDLIVKAINDGSTCESHIITNHHNSSKRLAAEDPLASLQYVNVKVDVLDINDNAPIFKRPIYRAGIHHRSLMNSLVTQVAAFDPDSGLNGTLNYRITEILMYKTSLNQLQGYQQQAFSSRAKYDITQEQQPISKPIKLIQFPFRVDNQGNLYTQQLLTQYQLMSMFVVSLEATEMAEPWRTARTKLEVYLYETGSQLKIRINLHPRLIETYKHEIEQLFSNATKYTAIINRAKSYHETNLPSSGYQQSSPAVTKSLILDNPPVTSTGDEQPIFSNIHLIFVDNFRIVNPSLVMEKFDLTSAQLFMPQQLIQGANRNNSIEISSDKQRQLQVNEVSSLIDKIALASVQAAEYHASPSSLAGIDWLESPSVLYTSLTLLLILIGFVIFLFGCCCTSRIKDHIVKVAMDKLVKQQNLQAKINEQVLAATASQISLSANGNGRLNGNPDYILQQQQGGFMSSFDATKGCITNNNENMNILQRAMESGEFIDPNYTTINGHVNMGAHFFDASELDQQQQQIEQQEQTIVDTNNDKIQANGSLENNNEVDDEDAADENQMMKSNGMPNNNGNYMMNNGHVVGLATGNAQRQRQQIPKV